MEGIGRKGGMVDDVLCVAVCSEFVDGVATRDVPMGDGGSLWLRIFLPQHKQSQEEEMKAKPVVLYAHGGGYCEGQPNWPAFHTFCKAMAAKSDSIWLSLSYRLAPQHRLPAAYDDGLQALQWLVAQARRAQGQPSRTSDPWLKQGVADFSNCFLAGESAGATIMLNVAMKASSIDLSPLSIKGLLLVHPGFHSEAKRGSMLDSTARFYEMALPPGQTLDYPPINPIHPSAPSLSPLSAYPNVLLSVAQTDSRYDLNLQFYDLVKGLCENVQLFITPGKGHAFHMCEPRCPESEELLTQLASFIHASASTAPARNYSRPELVL